MTLRLAGRGWPTACLLALALALPVIAEPVKVGFVNVAKVLDLAPQAEAARQRIEREFAPKDRELVELQRELRTLEDRLVRESAVMADADRARQEAEVRALSRDLRRAQDEFREDLNLRRSQELSSLQRKVTEVIQALARAERYDLIVTDGVVFAGERVDITDKVIERLKLEFRESEG
jgi:outer membrane protein